MTLIYRCVFLIAVGYVSCCADVSCASSSSSAFPHNDGVSLLGKRLYSELSVCSQVYGIATYDALFKYVLDDADIRPSFFHAIIPEYNIVASERIDEHMNPIQELQALREFVHNNETKAVVESLHGKTLHVCTQKVATRNVHSKATEFLNAIVSLFPDIKRAFPKLSYDGTMDFVCRMANNDYILVEMQVIPYDYWDKRALAYVAAFYGRQMKKGEQWKDIKKVIGINILGGGKDQLQHWADTPNEYVRHYKMQEQIHPTRRYIDGIEIIQYSLMNVPINIANQELKDWITFLKESSFMTEQDVEDKITTQAVKNAFKRAKLADLPDRVRELYENEEGLYSQYSIHTQEQIEKGIAAGIEKGIAEGIEKGIFEERRRVASEMFNENLSDDLILKLSKLTQEELDELKASVESESSQIKK